ncbi:MAG: murein biosynthesis integral membrane protein MurJ [Desulfobulbaceae bacterium]|nr:murein biosynthesis integral membrane protein MurJ [Desulfobulbaceae bacterium]
MKKPAKDTSRIARSAGTVSIAVTCSRVLGLIREQVFAYLFGAGYAYDAFVVAFRIPNLLRDLFGEGALSAAFVTVFSDYEVNRSERDTLRLAGNVMVFFVIILSVFTLLGIWQAENIVRLLVQAKFELTPGKVELTRLMTVIMFPFLIMVSLSSVCMGILNTRGHFFIPSVSSAFFNMGSIIGGVSLALVLPRYGHPAIVGMAIGTLIGGMLQLVGQFPSLKRVGFRFIPNLDLADPGLRRIVRLMVPAVAGLAALQINVFINSFFASSLQEGSLSWLNYAFRLFMLPVGVFGVAISIAAHPIMARQAATGSMTDLKESYVSTLMIAFCLTVPAAAGLIILAEPIIRLIFQYGRFDAFSTVMTSQALVYYAIGLASYAAVKVTVPVFYNINNTRSPVVGSFLAVLINLLVILLLIDHLQHRALALSISCAMTANFMFLFVVLYRKLSGLPLKYLAAGFLKVLLAALVMGGWLLALDGLFGLRAAGTNIIFDMLKLALCIISGVVVYGVVLYKLNLPELQLVVERLKER